MPHELATAGWAHRAFPSLSLSPTLAVTLKKRRGGAFITRLASCPLSSFPAA
jgi:hypothetical protein